MKLIKTTDKLISENYPYGFRLKTTKTDYLEFSNKHGFRHCSVTVNPKTGRLNNPKKSTYYDIMLLGTDETTGYTKSLVMDFYAHADYDKIIAFFSDPVNFNLFTSEQIEYIYGKMFLHVKADIYAQIQYCGSKFEDLKPLFSEQLNIIVKGIKEHGVNNYFSQIKFDWDKIDSFKVEGYQPFKVTHYRSA
jgi:hypothetical protein